MDTWNIYAESSEADCLVLIQLLHDQIPVSSGIGFQ